jgi:hypothetical protein
VTFAWWGEAIIHYADGSRWRGVSVFPLRDGLAGNGRSLNTSTRRGPMARLTS